MVNYIRNIPFSMPYSSRPWNLHILFVSIEKSFSYEACLSVTIVNTVPFSCALVSELCGVR